MGFYDNYNFDGLKLFPQIKEISAISEPCPEFISAVEQLKSTRRNISVAEVGLGVGATALRTLEILDEGDLYCCFDFLKLVRPFLHDVDSGRFNIKCKIVAFGNSELEWDSYNWNLSNLVLQMRERNEAGIFDAVYLDGAHTFLHDGPAVCLLKELITDGGYLVLDDVKHTYWPNYAEPNKNRMPQNQMEDAQVARVKKIFLDGDPNFVELSPPNAYRAVFRKHRPK